MAEVMIDQYRKLFKNLRNEAYFGRLGKTFKTKDNYYFLDTGTGKVAKVNENLYSILTCWLESDNFDSILELGLTENDLLQGLKEIKQSVETQNILSAPLLDTMAGEATLDLENALLKRTSGITLELTEECNLRCKYCIYHPDHPAYREFGKRHMPIEIAKKAVDFLFKNSSENEESVHIGFYGGEPLLNFEVLEETISYSKEVFQDVRVNYNLTTNAVLLSENICDYLVDNDVSVTISLDGPKEVHDANRIFANDTGSFDSVKKGIMTLVKSFKKFDKEPLFLINMVTSSQNSAETYDLNHDFFTNCDWIPKEATITCSGIDTGPRKADYVLPQSESEREITDRMSDLLGAWNDTKTNSYETYESNFATSSVNQTLVRIHKRFIADKPTTSYPMNGCCTPGQRRAYITIDGNILPCERVGTEIPFLGNVDEGYNIPQTKKHYVDDYIENSKEACKNCWAVNLCALCYNNCYNENGINMDFKNALCLEERSMIKQNLERYHTLLEKHPQVLEEFNEIELI